MSETDKANDGQIELSYILKEITEKSAGTEDAGPKGGPEGKKAQKTTSNHREVRGVQVVVVGGRGMPKMDSGPFGKCDPYLKLRCGENEQKTQVIKRTLAPTWNETFNFTVESEETDLLVVECYDYDMVGAHDFIGSVEIKPKSLNSKVSEWYKMTHPENPEFHAEVFLTLIPVHESMEEAVRHVNSEEVLICKASNIICCDGAPFSCARNHAIQSRSDKDERRDFLPDVMINRRKKLRRRRQKQRQMHLRQC